MGASVEEAEGDEVVGGVAMRVKRRSLVLTLSVSPFDRPWVTDATIPARWFLIWW